MKSKDGQYYCSKCERVHIKGKIFKEHLEFASLMITNDQNVRKELDNMDRFNPHEKNKRELLRNLIFAIKGTKLIEKKFIEILNAVDKLQGENRAYTFGNLISAIKGSELLELRFTKLLNTYNRIESQYQGIAFANFISAIIGTDLIKKYYSDIESLFIEFLDNFKDGNIESSKKFYNIIKSVRDTVLFRRNYIRIKTKFVDLLQRLNVQKSEVMLYDEIKDLIDTIEGTELIELIPYILQILKNLVYSPTYSLQEDHELTYYLFEDLIEIAKKSNLITEYFSKFSKLISLFMSDEKDGKKFPDISPFYYLFDAIKGTELVRIKFFDLMNLADELPSGYELQNNYEAFFKLIDEIKGTELMKGNISDHLKGLRNQFNAFDALIDAIKGTELMKKNFSDVLNLLDDFMDEKYDTASNFFQRSKYYAFARLINTLKATNCVNEYYELLEKRFFTSLNRVRGEYNYFIMIKAIEGTDFINKNLGELLNIIDKFPHGAKLRVFSKLISQIQDTELFLKENQLIEFKFSSILNGLQKNPTNLNSKDISNLIEAIGPELLNKEFSHILNVIDKIPNNSYKTNVIMSLIKDSLPKTFNQIFNDLLEVIDKLSSDEDKKKSFFILLNKIDVNDSAEKLPILKDKFPIYTDIIEKSYRARGLLF